MTALSWGGVTFGEWHHLAGRNAQDGEVKDIVYPHCSGRDYMVLGTRQTEEDSKQFVFAEEGIFRNRLCASSEGTLKTLIASIDTARITYVIATLTFSVGSFTNMRLVDFESGPIQRAVAAPSGYGWQCVWRGRWVHYY